MEKFTTLKAAAAPMPAANIDTDVIMPKAFLKRIDKEGVLEGLFHELRLLPSGEENPEFVLNQAPYRHAEIMLVGPNFGCGSSREHAVWGLRRRGIRVLVGSSFAGIFFDNCANNGLLCIVLPEETVSKLIERVSASSDKSLEIDLERQTISAPNAETIHFEIEPTRKAKLLAGLDEVSEVLREEAKINAFEKQYFLKYPWLKATEEL